MHNISTITTILFISFCAPIALFLLTQVCIVFCIFPIISSVSWSLRCNGPEPWVGMPECYKVDPETCNAFLTNCSLLFFLQLRTLPGSPLPSLTCLAGLVFGERHNRSGKLLPVPPFWWIGVVKGYQGFLAWNHKRPEQRLQKFGKQAHKFGFWKLAKSFWLYETFLDYLA